MHGGMRVEAGRPLTKQIAYLPAESGTAARGRDHQRSRDVEP
jgi:hypothetical protein